ncbi:MAG: peptide chain release factor N(5)-glutamine methyltransferase [Pseudomonadota bacterium]
MGQPSLEDLLRHGARRLRDVGIDDPRREARLLAGAALERDPTDLIVANDLPVDGKACERFSRLVDRRMAGEPVSRIVGWRGFWSLDLRVTPDVLDPRPDSECLIEQALAEVDGTAGPRILDIGTGSGCLLLALLSEWPQAIGTGIDLSFKAAQTARDNARACGLADRASFVCGHWLDGIEAQFDLIVSNPPYIRSGDIPTLDRSVADFDPLDALDGGNDGLDAYRSIIPQLADRLVDGGTILFEVGAGQAGSVKSLLSGGSLAQIASFRDLSGHERCVSARKSLE